jgi:hypothetical protein
MRTHIVVFGSNAPAHYQLSVQQKAIMQIQRTGFVAEDFTVVRIIQSAFRCHVMTISYNIPAAHKAC